MYLTIGATRLRTNSFADHVYRAVMMELSTKAMMTDPHASD